MLLGPVDLLVCSWNRSSSISSSVHRRDLQESLLDQAVCCSRLMEAYGVETASKEVVK